MMFWSDNRLELLYCTICICVLCCWRDLGRRATQPDKPDSDSEDIASLTGRTDQGTTKRCFPSPKEGTTTTRVKLHCSYSFSRLLPRLSHKSKNIPYGSSCLSNVSIEQLITFSMVMKTGHILLQMLCASPDFAFRSTRKSLSATLSLGTGPVLKLSLSTRSK